MGRGLLVVLAIAVILAITLIFGGLYVWRFGLSIGVLSIFAIAAGMALLAFFVGHLLGIRNHAYYSICGGLILLAVDFLMWQRFAIMPGPKFFQDGFVPASIMGLFLGPLYRVIAVADPQMTDRH